MKKLILILMILVGCIEPIQYRYMRAYLYVGNPIKTIDIYIDHRFTELEAQNIGLAISNWNYALNGRIRLQVVNTKFRATEHPGETLACLSRLGECWLINWVDGDDRRVMEEHDRSITGDTYKPRTYTLGWSNGLGGNQIYIIGARVPGAWVTGLAMHEMGHLLGAEHMGNYLMRKQYHWEHCQCIDYDTIKMVANYWKIPASGLNYCVYNTNISWPSH